MAINRFLPIENSVAWSSTANWTLGAVPVNTNDVELVAGAPDINTGTLDYLNTTLNILTVANTFTGTLGEAPSGTTLGNPFKINFVTALVGAPLGVQDGLQGPGRLRIDSNTAAVVSVYNTSASLDSSYGLEAFRWKNVATTGSSLNVIAGSVGFGTDGTGAYFLDNLTQQGGECGIGATSTVTTVKQAAGDMSFRGVIAAAGSFTQSGGNATIFTQTSIATIYVNGTIAHNGRAPLKSISGITRTSSTATATTSAAHGYANGDYVRVIGAVQTEYNGVFLISNITGTTFDYTVANTPTTPATTAGVFTCTRSVATTIQVQQNGTLDFSLQPSKFGIVNPIQLQAGSTLILFSADQIAAAGGSEAAKPPWYQCVGCGVGDVTITVGRNIQGRFDAI